MCGITGFFSYHKKISLRKYYRAHLKISHRGPDDEGFIAVCDDKIERLRGSDSDKTFSNLRHIENLKNSNLVIGHRRLSIIDLSSAGHQPFNFESLYLSYNGEIYNYIELRDELISLGYTFYTKTDSEVFIKAYHCWKEEAFNKFNGMWAASIYDARDNKLVLTRDRFGIKPLYYSNYDGALYFSSETKFIKDFISFKIFNLYF